MWIEYSSAILTWKYCVGLFFFGDLILGFFVGGESGEGGGVAGRMMVGDGVISVVSGMRWCLMVVNAVFCSVWSAGGGVSFSGVGRRRACVDLFVGLVVGTCIDSCGRLAQPELSPFRRTFSREESRQLYSRNALSSTAGITDMVIRWLDLNTSKVEGRMMILRRYFCKIDQPFMLTLTTP